MLLRDFWIRLESYIVSYYGGSFITFNASWDVLFAMWVMRVWRTPPHSIEESKENNRNEHWILSTYTSERDTLETSTVNSYFYILALCCNFLSTFCRIGISKKPHRVTTKWKWVIFDLRSNIFDSNFVSLINSTQNAIESVFISKCNHIVCWTHD